MAMILSALVLSLSLVVFAGLCYVYRSPQRFPLFAAGRYSGFAAVLATCVFGQGIAMVVANADEAAWWAHGLAAVLLVAAAITARRITSLSKVVAVLPEFEPFKPVTPEGPAPFASNSNKGKVRRKRAA